ncbi:hypothetical protein [Methylorubrum zatmanii]|uniref:DUF937 domain-containing protein n=1 Tax=Methylorubrum zatmanii TaxID=29429 RepID=A0ABW1WRB0_9HYPH|nr:hypothetical protein [Methylorubrum zatmanii]MBD8909020.1 hypothetical protein [Methylorubrum zatmanii]
MSFLLRAALVIGALSYLALLRRDGEAPVAPHTVAATGLAVGETVDRLTTGGIGALVSALPPETRETVSRAGAEVLVRHLAGPGAAPRPSADTLSAGDRQPSWRGPASH